jgi:hypothetical protein
MNANKRMRAGHFGALLWRAGRPYAALPAVERRTGRRFSAEQLDLVAAARRGRILTIEEVA